MKKEFSSQPATFREQWPGELTTMHWMDFLTAIPSPIFLVTSTKANGKPNACLQSWSTFTGDGQKFLCLLSAVNTGGHLYRTLREKGQAVLNFLSAEHYAKCEQTIEHNGYDDDELALSGLTVEPAVSVDAPRVAEAFLSMECTLLWEREQYEGCDHAVVCLEIRHIAMDSDHYDETALGRYGKTGYIYNIHAPRNPDTGEAYATELGFLTRG